MSMVMMRENVPMHVLTFKLPIKVYQYYFRDVYLTKRIHFSWNTVNSFPKIAWHKTIMHGIARFLLSL